METNLVLVDTSAWIFALRRRYFPSIKERIEQLLRNNLIVITGIIKVELLSGIRSEEEYKRLKNRLEALADIETKTELWDYTSYLAFHLISKGMVIPTTDIIIAATAILNKLTLLHADAHFDLLAKHTELKVESFVSLLQKITKPL